MENYDEVEQNVEQLEDELEEVEEENTFLPVILDKSNDVIDFDIDHHHISCSKQNLKILLENLLCLSIPMKSKIFMLPSSFVT